MPAFVDMMDDPPPPARMQDEADIHAFIERMQRERRGGAMGDAPIAAHAYMAPDDDAAAPAEPDFMAKVRAQLGTLGGGDKEEEMILSFWLGGDITFLRLISHTAMSGMAESAVKLRLMEFLRAGDVAAARIYTEATIDRAAHRAAVCYKLDAEGERLVAIALREGVVNGSITDLRYFKVIRYVQRLIPRDVLKGGPIAVAAPPPPMMARWGGRGSFGGGRGSSGGRPWHGPGSWGMGLIQGNAYPGWAGAARSAGAYGGFGGGGGDWAPGRGGGGAWSGGTTYPPPADSPFTIGSAGGRGGGRRGPPPPPSFFRGGRSHPW
jgi:hypothetical protein